MAFPTIPTEADGRAIYTTEPDTTSPRTSPNLSGLTRNTGDLLIAIVMGYQSTATVGQVWSNWTSGWTEFLDSSTTTNACIGAAYRWCDGTESGTISVTEAATITGHAAWILLSIPGAHASSAPEWGSRANGTTGIADPASFTPSWGAEDILWIAVGAVGEVSTTGSWTGMGTGPTNYTGTEVWTGMSGDVAGAVELAVAFRQLNAASEDVGVWTGTDISNARNAALVIAVRPTPSQDYVKDSPGTDNPAGASDAAPVQVLAVVRVPTDTAGAGDAAPAKILAVVRQPVDTAGAADAAPSVVQNVDRVATDTAGAADAHTAATKRYSGWSGTVTGHTAIYVSKTPSDSAGATDTSTRAVDYVRTAADSAGATDTTSRAVDYARSAADPAGATDATTQAVGYGRTAVDTAAMADAEEHQLGAWEQSKVDTAGATDSVTVVREIAQTAADSAGATDSHTVIRQITKTAADSAAATDSVTRASGLVRTAADSAGAVDSESHSLGAWNQSAADTAGATDSVVYIREITKIASDTAAAADSSSRIAAMARAVADTAGAADTLVQAVAYLRAVADVADALDIFEVEKIFGRDITVHWTNPRSRDLTGTVGRRGCSTTLRARNLTGDVTRRSLSGTIASRDLDGQARKE